MTEAREPRLRLYGGQVWACSGAGETAYGYGWRMAYDAWARRIAWGRFYERGPSGAGWAL